MSENFLKDWHKDIKNLPRANWTNIKSVSLIKCLPLYSILRETK
eukprot:gene21644-29712_t